MLAATSRLRRSAEFAAVVRAGDRAGRGGVVVHLVEPGPAQAGEQLPARAGFVVSRAVGPAVVRNRTRRRLRHLVRDRLNTLPPGTDLVVRALPAAATSTYAQLGADLDAAIAAARSRRLRAGGTR
ncbi:ribonuclease P protein component [Rhizomonospora bruguierae]|uniref:ribonuclease P protein component n=1 Tax=Rhizomonospora bruguierae TaxID=1581705 RepID=UPI001BCF9ADA|nr:ribonuclease P protein component [Micromonospora sp. NBRC 107566]